MKTKSVRKIGNEEVYPLQEKVAYRVCQNLTYNCNPKALSKRTALVCLQPQVGKTGVMVVLIDMFISKCIAEGKTFQVVVLCGLSQLELVDQTSDRLIEGMSEDGLTPTGAQLDILARKSGYARNPPGYEDRGIIIVNNSSKLKNLKLDSVKVDRRLFLIDEVHIGNNESGCIDKLLKRHGVFISEQIHTWTTKTLNQLVVISATPFAHLAFAEQVQLNGESLFEVIYEEPPSNYNSIEIMWKNGRLRQTSKLFIDGRITPFFESVMVDFHKECRRYGNGYLVIRACGKVYDQLISYINKNGKIQVKTFDSFNKNIKEFNNFLSQTPLEPTIAIIKGSMRAGITLRNDNRIRGWVETASESVDAQAQSGVGRACGYNRENDTYPIYCTLKSVQQYIWLCDQLKNNLKTKESITSIPAGRQNKGSHLSGKKYPFTFMSLIEAQEIREDFIEENSHLKLRPQISTTRDNFVNNIPEMLLRNMRDSGHSLGVHLNGAPTYKDLENKLRTNPGLNPKYYNRKRVREIQESYRQLLKAYPDMHGQVAMFDLDNYYTSMDHSRQDLQRNSSALKKA